jgi:hypothetical protein
MPDCCYAERRYAERRYTEHHYAERHYKEHRVAVLPTRRFLPTQ